MQVRLTMVTPLRRLSALFAAVLCAAVSGEAAAKSVLSNPYDLMFPLGTPEIWLDSGEDCGVLRCDIYYRISSRSIDRYVEVVWKDKNGDPLVSASSVNLGFFWGGNVLGPGVIANTEIRKNQNLGGAGSRAAVGSADFTGTGSGNAPCGTSYVCNDADYYEFLPSPFSPTPQQGAQAQRGAITPAADPLPLASIGGMLVNVGIAAADLGNPDAAVVAEVPFIELTSEVYDNGPGSYRYQYRVTNFTGLTVPFEWFPAGLSGELVPFGVAGSSFISAQAPVVIAHRAEWTLEVDDPFPLEQRYQFALEVLVPGVPELPPWLALSTGLAVLLGLRAGRPLSRH